MQIVDCHVHIGRWPKWDLHLTLDELRQTMQEYHYSAAVVIPPLDNGDDPVRMNLKLQHQVEKSPDLFFFPWIHVEPSGSNEDSLIEYLEENRKAIHGVKFHASISQMGIADQRLHGTLAHLDKEGLPLLYHCGRHPISASGPIKEIAPSYPHVPFIVAHLGGNAYDIVVDTLHLFRGDLPPNVYFDTSTARHPKLLRQAIETYGEDRILFGTDLPFTEMTMNWACLEFAGADKNEKILGGNLLRILGKSS
ncbi:MAG TPA: amidohydrolase family protein [Thermoplasmata archaeon]|jgi:predicted TIM-barrel fold metal-dependent hydrolase